MPRATAIQSNFTAGELTPRLAGRTDLTKYHNGVASMENFTVFPHGGISRRGGTEFINEVKDSTKKTRLYKFEFSNIQTYFLEFGENYIRFYSYDASGNWGSVISNSVPYEVVTTYLEDELAEMQFAQTGDDLYIVHPNHPPAILARFDHTNWTISDISFVWDENTSSPWSATNYPTCVCFYEQRCWYAGASNAPQAIWASRTGATNYADMRLFFNSTETGGTTGDVYDYCALNYTIATDRVNKILWLSPGKILACGTVGGEFTITSNNLNDAITPTNVRIVRQSTYGSAAMPALRISDLVLFVQRARRKVRQFTYQFQSDSYVAPDLTLLAEHITQTGIVDFAFQQEPDSILWLVRGDGELLGLTYQRDQDVIAWHRHIIGGTAAVVESVASVPGITDRDEVWLVVKRFINGASKRYIERLRGGMNETDPIEDSFFVDCGLTYNGTPTTSISGLDHLEGETVTVLADGGVVAPDQVVTGGAIILADAASIVHVGYSYKSTVQTMRLDVGSMDGSAQGKTGRIIKVVVRLMRTAGLNVGPDIDHLDELTWRVDGSLMDHPLDLFSGDKKLPFPKGYEEGLQMVLMQDKALPCTILSIISTSRVNN